MCLHSRTPRFTVQQEIERYKRLLSLDHEGLKELETLTPGEQIVSLRILHVLRASSEEKSERPLLQ